MRKAIQAIGIIAIAIVIFLAGYFGGYGLGSTPTLDEETAEAQRQAAAQDLFTIADKYSQLYQACEAKYQAGIDGDFTTAFELRGQQGLLEAEIESLLEKYDTPKIRPL